MDAYGRQAELIKAIAHPVRLQILDVLRDGEQCVYHIETVLETVKLVDMLGTW
jgi:DNA-binding transcriptional ArsR family regulator